MPPRTKNRPPKRAAVRTAPPGWQHLPSPTYSNYDRSTGPKPIPTFSSELITLITKHARWSEPPVQTLDVPVQTSIQSSWGLRVLSKQWKAAAEEILWVDLVWYARNSLSKTKKDFGAVGFKAMMSKCRYLTFMTSSSSLKIPAGDLSLIIPHAIRLTELEVVGSNHPWVLPPPQHTSLLTLLTVPRCSLALFRDVLGMTAIRVFDAEVDMATLVALNGQFAPPLPLALSSLPGRLTMRELDLRIHSNQHGGITYSTNFILTTLQNIFPNLTNLLILISPFSPTTYDTSTIAGFTNRWTRLQALDVEFVQTCGTADEARALRRAFIQRLTHDASALSQTLFDSQASMELLNMKMDPVDPSTGEVWEGKEWAFEYSRYAVGRERMEAEEKRIMAQAAEAAAAGAGGLMDVDI